MGDELQNGGCEMGDWTVRNFAKVPKNRAYNRNDNLKTFLIAHLIAILYFSI